MTYLDDYSISVCFDDGTVHQQLPLGADLITVAANGDMDTDGTQVQFQAVGKFQVRLQEGRLHDEGHTCFEIWNDLEGKREQRLVEGTVTVHTSGMWIEVLKQSSLPETSVKELRRPRRIGRRGDESPEEGVPPSLDTLRLWFEALGAVQRHPANSVELFQAVSKALVNPGGLDSAAVIVRNDTGAWELKASFLASPPLGVSFQYAAAERVEASGEAIVVESLADAPDRSVLAVPFFNEQGQFAGLLYAQRARTETNVRDCIRAVELQYALSLAESVTSGFRRLAMEDERNRIRYAYGRCFSPAVIRAIETSPELLEAREATVSVLLADLRQFTRISQELGSKRSFDLLTEVMNGLTEEVMATEGVIIDFYGDGLAAMWNAPQEQENFAARAAATAQRMHLRLELVNERWKQSLLAPLRMVTAIATGTVIVGNAGSDLRMKYGPRGTTVSLASRLEVAAKRLEVETIICGETRARLGDEFQCLRLGSARVPGIDSPFDVYQLMVEPNPSGDAFDRYTAAIDLFDQEKYEAAIDMLQQLNEEIPSFSATEFLRKQAEHMRVNGTRSEPTTIQFIPRSERSNP